MKSENLIGKTVKIKNVSIPNPCQNCHPCLRLRLMEMGLVEGQKLELSKHSLGLWVVRVLADNGVESFRLALRDEEFDRLVFEEDNCVINLV